MTYPSPTGRARAKAAAYTPTVVTAKRTVTLTCGHQASGVAPIGNPERWFCCGGWRRRRKNQ